MKGPTRKEELPQKLVARIEYEPKLCKVKRITSTSMGNKTTSMVVSTAFDEAKASCKARKRKERQESVSSLCQERKVIRSNSEERPVLKKCIENRSNIRRVSSSGDFPKSASLEKLNGSPTKSHSSDKTLTYEDYEHEKRRSHERFARPFTLKNNKKHPHKRMRVRYLSKTKFKPESTEKDSITKRLSEICSSYSHNGLDEKEDEREENKQENFLQIHVEERARSPSPVHTPISPMLDFSTLHEQVNSSEPQLSCAVQQLSDNTETLPSLSIASNRMLSSPRNSIIAMHRIYLDKDVPQTNASLEKVAQNPVDQRIQKVHKQINSLKKKIKVFESEFEGKNGYRPSHADKLNDKTIKKLYTDLSKLRKEQKQLSDVSANCPLIDYGKSSNSEGDGSSLRETVNEIEQKLAQKRDIAKRCYVIEDMTADELLDEKIAIQKALLYLESIHGRPNNKEDRNLVRPFYDRYRVLKRMVAKITTNIGGIELPTIHENETMNFVTPNSSSNETESEITENVTSKPNPLPPILLPSNSTDSETSDTSLSENLHSLSKNELMEQLKIVLEEKKELRRTIKQFELNFQMRTGKMLQKDDRSPMENVFMAYKKTKGKLRLLEALVGKQ